MPLQLLSLFKWLEDDWKKKGVALQMMEALEPRTLSLIVGNFENSLTDFFEVIGKVELTKVSDPRKLMVLTHKKKLEKRLAAFLDSKQAHPDLGVIAASSTLLGALIDQKFVSFLESDHRKQVNKYLVSRRSDEAVLNADERLVDGVDVEMSALSQSLTDAARPAQSGFFAQRLPDARVETERSEASTP